MVSWGMVDWSMVDWSIGVHGCALVGNLCDIAAVVVGCVAHCLHSAVRESHRVGAYMDESIGCQVNIISSTCDNTRGVSCLGLLELTAGVGVCDAVLVLVRSRLSFHWGMVHWGVVDWCLVRYHWCSVHHRGGVHQRGMVDRRMVDWCVVDGGVVDGTGVVERGVVKAVVASVSFNSVAVLSPLLLLLIEHHAFGSIVRHGSPL